MNRRTLPFLVIASLGTAVFACGGISDPTRNHETVATISGALTGTTVPSGAHVAVVWRKGNEGGLAVGGDAPVIDGHFTLELTAPPDSYLFTPPFDDDDDYYSGGSSPPDSTEPGPTPLPAPSPGYQLAPKTTASGSITQPMAMGVAGFVVYADANGNGKLDVEGSTGASPDTLLGGNEDLMLTFLKGGGTLDYEKLRDSSGILPTQGFNLGWEGKSGIRWIPLNLVELQLDETPELPNTVCSSYGGNVGWGEDSADAPVVEGSARTGGGTSGSTGGYYPPKDDPNLTCSADGRSYTYTYGSDCEPTPPPPPRGLCSGPYVSVRPGCTGGGYTNTLPPDAPIPEGWPCTPALDGGPGPDSGDDDAGAWFDAGSSP